MTYTLWDSYSAFANTDGGCILLGVKERDDQSLCVVGLKDAEKMKKDFWNMVNNRQKISVNLMTERRVRIKVLVISKTKNGFTFGNPGSMRMTKKVAIGGGVSDPRNGTVLKIFSLINYGERAGSGLNSIFHVWEHVYHTPVEINEEVGVDRVIVTLPNGGHDNILSDKLSDKQALKDEIKAELSEKNKISDKLSDRLSDIVVWTASEEFVSTNMVVSRFGIDERNARRHLTRLVDLNYLSAEGENKNKKYRYRKDDQEL